MKGATTARSARPCGGERHPVLRRAAEEAHAQLGLEPPDLLVNPGLGDGVREGADGAGVPAGARHPVEAGEAVQGVHSPELINESTS